MRRELVLDTGALRHEIRLQLAGAICQVFTNYATLGDVLQTWNLQRPEQCWQTFPMFVHVAPNSSEIGTIPHFRGMRHLVVASFGPANIFVFDLFRRTVTAAVTEELATDTTIWDRTLLPIAMGILGPAVGVLPIHAACVMEDGQGVLIAGASGMGKSTLSVALAQHGLDFVSDDWSYLTLAGDRLTAHGMAVPAKLLPDAVDHFPLLTRYSLGLALNQELAYELPVHELGAAVRVCCEPRWFLFLERTHNDGCWLSPVSSEEAQDYVAQSVEKLPPELTQMIQARDEIIDAMRRLSCWKLKYGGPPQVAVAGLRRFFAEQKQGISA